MHKLFTRKESGTRKTTTNTLLQSPIYAYHVLAILTLAYGIAQWHRNFFSVAAPILQNQLQLSDEQTGILTGIGFTIPYTVSGLIIGRIADIWRRKLLIVICVLSWSMATSLHGICSEFWHFLLCRLVIAIAQAGLSPCVYSLLADYFDSHRRSTALALYTFGIFMGYSASFLLGILLPDKSTESISWRYIFVSSGVPGIVLALVAWISVMEPSRGRFDMVKYVDSSAQTSTNGEVVDDVNNNPVTNSAFTSTNHPDPAIETQPLLTSKDEEPGSKDKSSAETTVMNAVSLMTSVTYFASRPSFWMVNIAVGIRGIASWTLIAWIPTFYDRIFDMNSVEQGYWLSWIFPLGGAIGLLLSGILADKLASKAFPSGRAWICAISCLLSILAQTGMLMVPHPTWSMLMMIPTAMTSEMWNGCAGSIVVEICPPQMRTLASSVMFCAKSLIGGIGPWIIAYLNMLFEQVLTEHGKDTRHTIRYSMLTLLNVTCLVSALAFASLSLTTSRDIRAKENFCEQQQMAVSSNHGRQSET